MHGASQSVKSQLTYDGVAVRGERRVSISTRMREEWGRKKITIIKCRLPSANQGDHFALIGYLCLQFIFLRVDEYLLATCAYM